MLQQRLKNCAARNIFEMWAYTNDKLLYRMCGGLRAACECTTCKDTQWTLDNNVDDLFQDYVDKHVRCTLSGFTYWCKHRLAHGWG